MGTIIRTRPGLVHRRRTGRFLRRGSCVGSWQPARDYDNNGNRSRDERGTHEFNARNQRTRWTRAAGRPNPGTVVTYELNASGAVLTRTDSGQTVAFDYTEESVPGTRFIGDRLIKTTQAGQATMYAYNSVGDITKIDAPGATNDTTYGYDDFGRRTASSGPSDGGAESYSYDALDRRDTKIKAGKRFDYAYVGLTEKLSREQQTQGGSETRSYDYDSSLNRMGQSRTLSAGAATTYRPYASDANGSVEGLETKTAAAAWPPAIPTTTTPTAS